LTGCVGLASKGIIQNAANSLAEFSRAYQHELEQRRPVIEPDGQHSVR
jgi:hypothetical protein